MNTYVVVIKSKYVGELLTDFPCDVWKLEKIQDTHHAAWVVLTVIGPRRLEKSLNAFWNANKLSTWS